MAKKLLKREDFYAKDKEYLDNPKYVWTVFAKLIKKFKKYWVFGTLDVLMDLC